MSSTPGPWTIDHQRIGPPGEPVALLCDVNDPMSGTVIDWPRGNDSGTAMSIDDAENEANARLIAAAPELLESLRDLLGYIEATDDDIDHTEMCLNTGDAVLNAEAAIAKATNGQEEER
mgnify:CR=1 FL=1